MLITSLPAVPSTVRTENSLRSSSTSKTALDAALRTAVLRTAVLRLAFFPVMFLVDLLTVGSLFFFRVFVFGFAFRFFSPSHVRGTRRVFRPTTRGISFAAGGRRYWPEWGGSGACAGGEGRERPDGAPRAR